MAKYNQGDNWSARDATYVSESVPELESQIETISEAATVIAHTTVALPAYSGFSLHGTSTFGFRPTISIEQFSRTVGVIYTNGSIEITAGTPFHAFPILGYPRALRVVTPINQGDYANIDEQGRAVRSTIYGQLFCVTNPEDGIAMFIANLDQPYIFNAKTTQIIHPGGSGQVELYGDQPQPEATGVFIDEVHHKWMHGNVQISANKECRVRLFRRIWRFEQAECE